jgi:Amt family ammonium transporter
VRRHFVFFIETIEIIAFRFASAFVRVIASLTCWMSRKTLMRKICVDRSVIAVFFFMALTPPLWAQASVPTAIPSDSDRLAKVEQQVADAKASADNAWMLTSAALVLMMTGPGLALFYGGLVRKKNVLSTMMQSFAMMALISVLWALCSYSLAFGSGTSFIGGFHHLFLKGVGLEPDPTYSATIPQQTFMIYQLMFAIITPALITGAFAERMKFSAMAVFMVLWSFLVYDPMAHMIWGKGGLLNAALSGRFPTLDFAGGTVVHITSGVSALVCAIYLGRRLG